MQGGPLRLVLFALLAGLEALGEQGAQHTDNDPQHSGRQQGEEEQEHQHKGGGNKKLNHVLYLVVLECGCGGWNRTSSAGQRNRYVTITPPRRI